MGLIRTEATMKNAKLPDDASSKVLELFEQGKRLTEDLLKENEKLRFTIASLKNKQSDLENKQTNQDNKVLIQRIKTLESEVSTLSKEVEKHKKQFSMIEDENREFAERYVKVERQNSDLINMYVASYRLHSTLNYKEVVNIIKEVVINMIGAEIFGVFIVDHGSESLELIAHEGLEEFPQPKIPVGDGVVGKTATDAEIFVSSAATEDIDFGEPLACFPLKVDEDVMGVIAIYKLLVQKTGLQDVDYEMFGLVGGHAATALYGAKMYSISERKRSTLEGFVDLLKSAKS